MFYNTNVQYLDDWNGYWWDIVYLKAENDDVQSSVYDLPHWSLEHFPLTPQTLDYTRFIFAGTAMGYDPHDLEGRNLVEELASMQKEDGVFGNVINHHIWAMITLDAVDADYDREAALQKLLDAQCPDGGYSLEANSPTDADVTSMALIALSDYKENAAVDEAIHKAVDFLKSKQEIVRWDLLDKFK